MTIGALRSRIFKGFLAHDEAQSLYERARDAARFGPCLEIGSYCGHSAAYLGLGCREAGGVLFSIDHHYGSEEQQPGQAYHDPELLDPETGRLNTFPLFRKTMRELSLENTVIPIVAASDIVARHWRTPLSLIFIDGGHTIQAVFTDYSSWISHLLPGGYLLIHDIFPEAAQGGQAPFCIYQLALASGLFIELPMIRTLATLKRAPVGCQTEESQKRWAHRGN